MPIPVFISHSSTDRPIAERLVAALEARGVSCWVAWRDVSPGDNFAEAIVQTIKAARIMVLVFSAHANNSEEIKKELTLASQNGLAVIPLRIEDVRPTGAFEYQLSTRQWIDLIGSWEQGVNRLVARIGEFDGTPKPPSEAPTPHHDFAAASRRNRALVPTLAAGVIVAASVAIWFGFRSEEPAATPHRAPAAAVAQPALPPQPEQRAQSTPAEQPPRPASPTTQGNYPQYSDRIVPDAEADSLTCVELRIARNEIFARHGYEFRTLDLRQLFAMQPWYHATSADVSASLTAVERKNIDTLRAVEVARRC